MTAILKTAMVISTNVSNHGVMAPRWSGSPGRLPFSGGWGGGGVESFFLMAFAWNRSTHSSRGGCFNKISSRSGCYSDDGKFHSFCFVSFPHQRNDLLYFRWDSLPTFRHPLPDLPRSERARCPLFPLFNFASSPSSSSVPCKFSSFTFKCLCCCCSFFIALLFYSLDDYLISTTPSSRNWRCWNSIASTERRRNIGY